MVIIVSVVIKRFATILQKYLANKLQNLKFARLREEKMPKIKFSTKKVESLKSEEKSKEYFEDDRKHGEGSFGIRVSPKGLKTWFAMYTFGDKVKRFTIGNFPDLSLSKARTKMTAIMTEVNNGIDPQQDKTDYRSAPTMTDLWEEYQDALRRKKKAKAASNMKEENRKWFVEIKPVLGAFKVKDIRRQHLKKLLDDIAGGTAANRFKKSPTVANRTFSLLQVVFKVALDLGWIDNHPMFKMAKPGGSEQPRKRVLLDEEIKILWPMFSQSSNQGDLFKLQLLTAARSGELMQIKWDDIKDDVLVLRRTKAGNSFLIPLSPQAIKILSARPKLSEWIFPSNSAIGHTICVKSTRNRIQSKCVKEGLEIDEWTNHDLRRTARTIMSRLQIKNHIRERVMNHSQGGVAGVYDLHDYLDEKKDALQKLGQEIDYIVGVAIRPENPAKTQVVEEQLTLTY